MKKPAQHLIAEVPRRQAKVEITIGIDLGDVWSHYCTLNQDGEVVDRGRFRTTPKAIEKGFTAVSPARIAMEAGTHSIWIGEQVQGLWCHRLGQNVFRSTQPRCYAAWIGTGARSGAPADRGDDSEDQAV